MFVFKLRGRRIGNLAHYLNEYLKNPAWVHAQFVVPLWAAIVQQNRTELPWLKHLEYEVTEHLMWVLQNWSAFRGSSKLETKRRRFKKNIRLFVKDVRNAIVKTRQSTLVSLNVDQLDSMTYSLEKIFTCFGNKVKNGKSFVLPAKTAHLLFSAVIPAYDREMVENLVLHRLSPKGMDGTKTFERWMRLCWTCLRILKEQGTLDSCRRKVFRYLMGKWPIRILGAQYPNGNDRHLSFVDTYLAEYILIALANTSGIRVVLSD